MVLFNRFGISPLAVSGTGLDSVFRAAEDMAAQFAGQVAGQVAGQAGAAVATGYGELTRATVRATETGALLEVVAPGFGPDDIELSVKRDGVTIRGERGAEGGPKHTFTRTWRAAWPIDADGVRARIENGILTVEVPRHAADAPRIVAIEGQTAKVQPAVAEASAPAEGELASGEPDAES